MSGIVVERRIVRKRKSKQKRSDDDRGKKIGRKDLIQS